MTLKLLKQRAIDLFKGSFSSLRFNYILKKFPDGNLNKYSNKFMTTILQGGEISSPRAKNSFFQVLKICFTNFLQLQCLGPDLWCLSKNFEMGLPKQVFEREK